MSARSEDYKLGMRDGLRWTITWLHARAKSMNDPHARDILNSAAFALGNELREATFLDHRAAGVQQGWRSETEQKP